MFVFVVVVVVALDVVVTVGGAAVAVEGIQHLHAPRQMISVSEARKVKGKEALTEQSRPAQYKLMGQHHKICTHVKTPINPGDVVQ